jgi:uncharacterized protein YaeQ
MGDLLKGTEWMRYALRAMALSSTIHHFDVQLSDVDRNVYEQLVLKLAQHPSETPAFMLTRLLAYCLEYREGIVFTDGIAAVDEPAVLVRDLTGRVTAWVEVGAPDIERLHRGSKLAGVAAVYSHRDPAPFLALCEGKKLHRAAEIPVYAFGRGFIEAATAVLQRRNEMSLSVTERQLYLDLNGQSFSTALEEHRIG